MLSKSTLLKCVANPVSIGAIISKRHARPLIYLRYASSISDSLPKVAQPSLWKSLVPKPMRKSGNPASTAKHAKTKEWNPATFYIIIYLLIGSNAINMIALRRDFVEFSRRADQQISKLREVIELVRQGKDVDVEAMLGTGDPQREQEWEDILKEIERGEYAESDDTNDTEARNTRDHKSESIGDQDAFEGKEKSKEEKHDLRHESQKPIGFY